MNGPSHPPFPEKPVSAEYLQSVRDFLAKMPAEELRIQYAKYLEYCSLQDGKTPEPWALQFLVQAWKELRKRG